MMYARLTGATLTGATLTGARLGFVVSGGIVGSPRALPGPWRLRNGYLVGPRANLAGADLRFTLLMGANLTA